LIGTGYPVHKMLKNFSNLIENPTLYFTFLIFPFFFYYTNLIYWQYWLLISIIGISLVWVWIKSTRLLAIIIICYVTVSMGWPLSENVHIPASCSKQIDSLIGTLKSKTPNLNNEIQLINAKISCQTEAQNIPFVQIKLTPKIQERIKWLRVGNVLEISNFQLKENSRYSTQIKPDKKFKIFNISRKQQILSRSPLLLYIQKKAEYYLSPSVSALFQSIVTADKTHLSKSLKNKIRIMGIAHILAISGLHIGIIYYWLTLVIRLFLWMPLKYLNKGIKIVLVDLISVIMVAGYITMIGVPLSALRAFIMLCWWCLVKHLLSWQPLPFILIGTALIILIYNPLSIGMLSFQLSFISVLGIIMMLPILPVNRIKSGIIQKTFNYFLGSSIICSWLFLVNLPLVSYINVYFTMTSIVTNIIHVIFLGCLFLPLSILIFSLIALSYPLFYFPGEYYLFAVLNIIGKSWEHLMNLNYSWHKFLWWEFSGSWGVWQSFVYWAFLWLVWLILKKNQNNIKMLFRQIYSPNSANN